MKERSIQFNAEMVRATLAGLKTQTRRPINPQPWSVPYSDAYGNAEDALFWRYHDREDWPNSKNCPYGRTGDRLRISEDVTVNAIDGRRYQMHYAADDSVITRFATPELYAKIKAYKRPRLRGVNLPAAYARDVRLEITGIRVERLSEISEADCWLEGIEEVMHDFDTESNCLMAKRLGCCIEDAKPLFALLWESVYGPGSFDARWVWVIEYRLIDPLTGATE